MTPAAAAHAGAGGPALDPAGHTGFDPSRRYRLHPDVALRPEPFGALAYHYGTRRLSFVRSADLAEVVRHLGEHASVDAALEALAPATRRAPFCRALAALAESGFLDAC